MHPEKIINDFEYSKDGSVLLEIGNSCGENLVTAAQNENKFIKLSLDGIVSLLEICGR